MDEAAGRNPSLPIEEWVPPPQSSPSQEPFKLPGLPSVSPVFADSPKPTYPLLTQPSFEQPKLVALKPDEPAFVPPELQSVASLPMVVALPKQDLGSHNTFVPAQSSESPQSGGQKVSAPAQPALSTEAQSPVLKKAANASPSKPVFGVRSSFSQSPWVSASKLEESKEVPKASPPKYVFKSGPQSSEAPKPQPRPQAVPLVVPEDANKPKTLLDEIRERSCLRSENPNEWECPACHLYNNVEFIQCETCGGENKVLAGVLVALEKPGKKRVKGLVEKGVDKAKSWFGW